MFQKGVVSGIKTSISVASKAVAIVGLGLVAIAIGGSIKDTIVGGHTDLDVDTTSEV